MKAPKIINSVWHRNVPAGWSCAGEWRTDIPASVLNNYSVESVALALDCGLLVNIPIKELRRVLAGAPTRRDGTLIGPFNLSPLFSTVNGRPVDMIVEELGPQTNPIYHE